MKKPYKLLIVAMIVSTILLSCAENETEDMNDGNKDGLSDNTIHETIPITEVHIESEKDWCNMADHFNNKTLNYADHVQVIVAKPLNFNMLENYSLGTESTPFSGKIDFCNNTVCYQKALISYASSVEICNMNVLQDSCSNVNGALINQCTDIAKISNVLINCGNPRGNTDTMFFDSCVFIENGNKIELTNVEMSNVIISKYDSASGLVGACDSLTIHNLSITSSMIHAQCGYQVTDAAIIARSAEEIDLSDVIIRNSAVSALHYASGCAMECRKLNVNNVTYENCFVYVFQNPTLPGIASGLVTRNLEEVELHNFNQQNLILNTGDSDNMNAGRITGDCSSKYYEFLQ